MVYGACFWPKSVAQDMKKEFGFNGKFWNTNGYDIDSKQLKAEDRETMFEKIKEMEFTKLGYFVAVLNADMLSNEMMSEGRNSRNLN